MKNFIAGLRFWASWGMRMSKSKITHYQEFFIAYSKFMMNLFGLGSFFQINLKRVYFLSKMFIIYSNPHSGSNNRFIHKRVSARVMRMDGCDGIGLMAG